MTGEGAILTARGAGRRFGAHVALEPTDFELHRAERVALVGPNGAGKSTLLALLAGGEIYGLPGALIALPLLAVVRAMWEFFSERIMLEPWREGGVPPVEVELEEEPPPPIAAQR